MSELSIELLKGSHHFRVDKVVERRENGPGGFPEVDILDACGRMHTISACDMSHEQFNKIVPGAIIKVDLKEQWSNLRVLD